MSFEIPEKREVKERLIFDSGLYLGLGVSLILSGIYEALKIRAERRNNDRSKVSISVTSTIFHERSLSDVCQNNHVLLCIVFV